MKLRIRGDSIRLRLKRNEVDMIAAGETLAERTHFPGAVFTYSLEASTDGEFDATFDTDTLMIRLPVATVADWAAGDDVSLFTEQDAGGGNSLALLVEKDFQCLSPGHHRTGEDDDDTYPHPEGDTGRGC